MLVFKGKKTKRHDSPPKAKAKYRKSKRSEVVGIRFSLEDLAKIEERRRKYNLTHRYRNLTDYIRERYLYDLHRKHTRKKPKQ